MDGPGGRRVWWFEVSVVSQNDPTKQTYRQRVGRVQWYIEQHLDEDLSLSRLARVAHFSPYHFHRIFQAVVGESVAEYVRRLRLEQAAFLLKTTSLSVTAVGLETGYGTLEAFSRAFRQMFGVSPSGYRRGQKARTPQLSEFVTNQEETTMSQVKSTQQEPEAIEIQQVPPRRVAYLRHVGPYDQVGPTFARLSEWAGRRGLFGPETLVLGICHDDPDVTAAENIRFDACVTVAEEFQLDSAQDGEVALQRVPGGLSAVATHRGPYTQLDGVYRWLYGTFLPNSGHEPRNCPPYEVYLNDPLNTPAEEVLTQIYIPLSEAVSS